MDKYLTKHSHIFKKKMLSCASVNCINKPSYLAVRWPGRVWEWNSAKLTERHLYAAVIKTDVKKTETIFETGDPAADVHLQLCSSNSLTQLKELGGWFQDLSKQINARTLSHSWWDDGGRLAQLLRFYLSKVRVIDRWVPAELRSSLFQLWQHSLW